MIIQRFFFCFLFSLSSFLFSISEQLPSSRDLATSFLFYLLISKARTYMTSMASIHLELAQFMSKVLPLIVGTFPDVMEELELEFFICRSRNLDSVLFFSFTSIDIICGIFITWWFVTIRTNVVIRLNVFICNSRIR